jgi:hypothetical protein
MPWCSSAIVGLIAVIAGALVLTGCSAPTAAPTAVPTWELANAEPFAPISVGRGRLSFDRPLPAHLLQDLCPEFTLVVIKSAKDWQDVQHRLQLPAPLPNIDLAQGSIVGLVANVGESMDDRWPITFRCLRRRGTEGSLEATFSPGVYYPMLTASYVDLVYAPGIRTIGLVAIDNRRFVIRSTAAH